MIEVFVTYLLFEIEYQKDIRDGTFNNEDYRWKQGQIDYVQGMIDNLLGTELSNLDIAMKVYNEMVEAGAYE